MSGVNNELRKQLWSASSLAMDIALDGRFPVNYKSDARYINAKFQGDLYTFVDRENEYNAGYIGVNDTGIVVSFRGTKSKNIKDLKDWMNNIKVNHVDFAPYGKVHEGFYKAVKNIYIDMIYKIKELIGSNKNKKIYITGHSKGGAMAFLMACKVVMEGLPKPLVVTFGAPRVGDYEFATKYNIETYRYESFTDAVPHLPFTRDEKILISRLSPVYEKALDAVDSDAIKVIVGFKELSDYYPVGKYVRVDISHGKYSNIPKSINKDYGETLDSLCAVEWIVRQKNFDEITSSHTMDYKY